MSLTDVAVRNAKGREKAYKLTDGHGLYLLVKTDGAKYWRFDYRHMGKRKTLAAGVYPAVSLVDARKRRDAAKEDLADHRDPGIEKKRAAAVARLEAVNTFGAVAQEWKDRKLIAEGASEATIRKVDWLLTYLIPELGKRPIAQIDALELLEILQRIEKQGLRVTANMVRSLAGQIFRYAIVTRRAKHDPAADLRDALAAPITTHHAALFDPSAIGQLLRDIDNYEGFPQVVLALKIAPHVFVRPSELRFAEWTEFNFDTDLWRIPGPKMKMKDDHIVPLSRQVKKLLLDYKELRRGGRYIFSAMRTKQTPMSDDTVNKALRRLGYSGDEVTGHGFRRTASTLLNEMGWNADWVERQLAHIERNKVRGAYNAALYLPDRTRMMQAWSDHLDSLRSGT